MTNTPPPRNDEPRDDAPESTDETDAPVFDDVAAEHPEVQDAAPDLIEPDTEDDRAPQVEPTAERQSAESTAPALIEPATAQPAVVQDAPADEVHETEGYDERIEEPRAGRTEPEQVAAVPAPAATPPVQTVYVTAPVAPKKKGNRGFGLLFALLALLVFALLLVAVMAIVLYAMFPGDFLDRLAGFVTSSAFIVPLVVFIVAFAILVLITNRASWWAYVLGSFLVALAVYFGSIGVFLLLNNALLMTPDEATSGFWQLAAAPSVIVAGILAREVTIWFGAAIASRGRKVKARNLEAQAAYERELDNQPLGFS